MIPPFIIFHSNRQVGGWLAFHLNYGGKKVLKEWMIANISKPFPNKIVKQELAASSNLTHLQLENWLKHARRSKWFEIEKQKNN